MDTTLRLTAAAVRETFLACLYDSGRTAEETKDRVEAKGVRLYAGFQPSRLKRYAGRIHELVELWPVTFFEGTGDSFLNACDDRNHQTWGEHENIDQLLCLGLAIERIVYVLPRELWNAFPGGMPFFRVLKRVAVDVPLRGAEAE